MPFDGVGVVEQDLHRPALEALATGLPADGRRGGADHASSSEPAWSVRRCSTARAIVDDGTPDTGGRRSGQLRALVAAGHEHGEQATAATTQATARRTAPMLRPPGLRSPGRPLAAASPRRAPVGRFGAGRSLREQMRMGPHTMLPRDREAVKDASIDGRVIRRAWAFARPFRWAIFGFLGSIVLDALIALLPPLIFREIIDTAIPAGDRRQIWLLAGLAVGVAIGDAGLAIVQRWYSARIGEGLIYELRVALFDKVQRMPVAFFTRTQTGALDQPPEQRRRRGPERGHLDARIGRLQRHRAGHDAPADAVPGVEADDPHADRAAAVHLPGQAGRPEAGDDRPRADEPQLPPEHADDRALQRGRRHPREAVRPVRGRAPRLLLPRVAGAGHGHPVGHVRAGVLRGPGGRRRPRRRDDLRRRRPDGHRREHPGRDAGGDGGLHRAHLPAADGPDERPGRPHELAGQLRAGLRGPRRTGRHRRQADRHRPRAARRGGSSSSTCRSATRRPTR